MIVAVLIGHEVDVIKGKGEILSNHVGSQGDTDLRSRSKGSFHELEVLCGDVGFDFRGDICNFSPSFTISRSFNRNLGDIVHAIVGVNTSVVISIVEGDRADFLIIEVKGSVSGTAFSSLLARIEN